MAHEEAENFKAGGLRNAAKGRNSVISFHSSNYMEITIFVNEKSQRSTKLARAGNGCGESGRV